MSSLQEQLLKAGMVDAKKAKKLKKEKRKQHNKAQHAGEKTEADKVKEAAVQALQEKTDKDKAQARERNELEQQKQIGHQIKQLILSNRVDKGSGDNSYQFSDNKKIKKIFVTLTLHKRLASGVLAIAELDGSYELIPARIAEKIAERDPTRIKVLNAASQSKTEVEEDDPYADYEIPDDLMW